MKSKTSFFNSTVLRKDITRFAPVWGLYLIGMLLFGLELMDFSNGTGYRASTLAESIAPFAVCNLIYALVCAEVLFGDLFNNKLCNALHALPLRREGWFLTHTIAGIGFSVVPNFILSLCFIPFMDGMWYISALWLLGVTLEFLFFFGLAALCAVCTGNRLGMAAVYAIVNFLSLIAAWFVEKFYEPLLYGLHIRYDGFWLFSPAVWLSDMDGLVNFETETITEMVYMEMYGSQEQHTIVYTYNGLGDGWWYVAVLTALGLAFLALGMVLYRRRKLESAGDLIAFRPMMPVFSVIFTLSAGAVFQLLMGGSYIFLTVGIVVSYFVCQMLMQRTVKVFRPKAFLKCAAIGGALLLSILAVWLDPFGVTSWVPEAEDVESIVLSDNYYFDYDLEYNDERAQTIDNPALIRELVEVHAQILREGDPQDAYYEYEYGYAYPATNPIHLTYKMADGREIQRQYWYWEDGAAAKTLTKFFSSPEFILGYEDWEEFLSGIACVYVDWDEGQKLHGEDAIALAEAIKADCEAGNMTQTRDDYAPYYINIELADQTTIDLQIFEDCENTLKWLRDHDFASDTKWIYSY